MRLNNKGFTLIEIIAVITIMGILSGTVIAGVSDKVGKSHKEFCDSQVNMLEVAGRMYFDDNMSLLPMNMGVEECVTLEKLENGKYIEELKDYSNNVCDTKNSKVCSIKHLRSGYFYTTYLNCNKCSTDNNNNRVESTPKITFQPDGGENKVNKDITVTMKITDTINQIASYSYTVYQKTKNGDIPVQSIDFKEYKGDIKIKLNRKGVYYIKGYAYNSIGKLGENTSKDYTLRYQMKSDCGNQIEVVAKKNDGKGLELIKEKEWMKGELEITIKKKGDIESYDVYVSENGEEPFKKIISGATAQTRKIKYNNTKTAKYRLYVVGYNDQGDVCRTDNNNAHKYYEYYQDNTPPKCEVTGSPDGWNKKWLNKPVTLKTNCDDGEIGSGCDKDKLTSHTINTDFNSTVDMGLVYDNVGNKGMCDRVTVRIDMTPPTCDIQNDGTMGNNDYYISTVTARLNTNDPLKNNVSSGVSGYDITTSTTESYQNRNAYTYYNDTNNYINVNGYVKDEAGNKGSCKNRFKIDKTPPTYNYTFNGWPIGGGWR